MAGKKDKKNQIIEAYMDYILLEGKQPSSVYAFAKLQKMKEEEFYEFFTSFDKIEATIWIGDFEEAVKLSKNQEVWDTYSSREKMLAFFYTYFELIRKRRSFVIQSLKCYQKGNMLQQGAPLKGLKSAFESFSKEVLATGFESGEIKERKGLSDRYSDGLWLQFRFILDFWTKDNSSGFEKTDAAIEKSLHLSFDLFGTNPVDSMIDFGKFLFQNTFSSPNESTR
jgi:hypothetical protein